MCHRSVQHQSTNTCEKPLYFAALVKVIVKLVLKGPSITANGLLPPVTAAAGWRIKRSNHYWA